MSHINTMKKFGATEQAPAEFTSGNSIAFG
jgi:hypothetical protein